MVFIDIPVCYIIWRIISFQNSKNDRKHVHAQSSVLVKNMINCYAHFWIIFLRSTLDISNRL